MLSNCSYLLISLFSRSHFRFKFVDTNIGKHEIGFKGGNWTTFQAEVPKS